jgi:hypothetical protein
VVDGEGHDELIGLVQATARPEPRVNSLGTTRADVDPIVPPGACRYLHLEVGSTACLALAPAIGIALRQVTLVCAGSTHADCPRFARGGAGERPRPPIPARLAEPRVKPVGEPPRGAIDLAPEVPAAALEIEGSESRAGPSPNAPEGSVDAAGRAEERFTPLIGEAPVASEPEWTPDLVSPDGSSSQGAAQQAAGPRRPPSLERRGLPQAHVRTVFLRPATGVALSILAGALVLAIVLVAARGGLALPATGSPSPGVAVAASAGLPVPSRPTAPAPSPAIAEPSPALAPATRAPVTPAPSQPAPAPPRSAGPTYPPDKLALLTACPGQQDCYEYRIRPGDNLRRIAALFGVSYNTVVALNPQIANPSVIHVGDVITLPPPGS